MSYDGKCPDIYDCRMGVDKILRENARLRSCVRELKVAKDAMKKSLTIRSLLALNEPFRRLDAFLKEMGEG